MTACMTLLLQPNVLHVNAPGTTTIADFCVLHTAIPSPIPQVRKSAFDLSDVCRIVVKHRRATHRRHGRRCASSSDTVREIKYQVLQLILMAIVPSIATIPTNLLEISATRQTPHPNSRPSELGHQLRQSSARSSTAAVLRDLQDIEHSLCGDPLDPVVTGLRILKRCERTARVIVLGFAALSLCRFASQLGRHCRWSGR
jgi:hypothetical protein